MILSKKTRQNHMVVTNTNECLSHVSQNLIYSGCSCLVDPNNVASKIKIYILIQSMS